MSLVAKLCVCFTLRKYAVPNDAALTTITDDRMRFPPSQYTLRVMALTCDKTLIAYKALVWYLLEPHALSNSVMAKIYSVPKLVYDAS